MKNNTMVVDDELGRQLHDRATRGEELSKEDQMLLDAWYEAQDRAEIKGLNLAATDEAKTIKLQKEIDSVLIQLRTATKRIQEITRENDVLRQEIARMRQQLTQQMVTQPA